jgi:hypothetical protein
MDRCFNIHAVIDAYKGEDLDQFCLNKFEERALTGAYHYHTHGLKEKGLPELCAVMKPEFYSSEEMADLINSIADLMLVGEEFNLNKTHYIDNEKTGEIYHVFGLVPSVSYGEIALRIVIPDKDYKFHYLEKDSNADEIFKIQTTNIIELLDEDLSMQIHRDYFQGSLSN